MLIKCDGFFPPFPPQLSSFSTLLAETQWLFMIRRFPKSTGLCLLLELVVTAPASHLEVHIIAITQYA